MAEGEDRKALRGLIRESWGEMNTLMLTAVRAEVPAYGDVPPEDVGRNLAETAFLFVKDLGGDGLEAADIEAQVRLGNRRASLGMGQDDLDAAVDAGVAAGVGHVLRLIEGMGLPPQARTALNHHVVTSVLRTQAAIRRARAAGFAAFRASIDSGAADSAPFVDRLLTASPDDWDAVEALAREHGLLDGSVGVVVLVAGRGADVGALRETGRSIAERVPGAVEGPVYYGRPAHLVLLAALRDAADWPVTVQSVEGVLADGGVLFAAPRSAVDLADAPAAFERCRRNLGLARILPRRGARLDLGLLQMGRVIADSPGVERLYLWREVIRPLVRLKRSAVLIEMLDWLVALGSYEAVAAQLKVADRTIANRREEIEAATGYTWLDDLDRLVMTNAALCRWIEASDLRNYDAGVWGPAPSAALMGVRRP